MKRKELTFIAALIALLALPVCHCRAASPLEVGGSATTRPDVGGVAATAPTTQGSDIAGESTSELTVAILDFESSSGNPELGKQVGEALAATLSGQPGFTLVDRASISRTLQENDLNLTGLVNADQAIKIGKLVGARILVTGRVFPLDKQLFFTAKLIGAETSLVDGVLIKGDKDADVGDLLMKLSEKVAVRLREAGPRLVAQPDAGKDPLPELKKIFAGKKLPKVSIQVEERHISRAPLARMDPAVATEIRSVFGECGFKIIDDNANDEANANVKLVISGEAFSEFAARIGDLVSCVARVEVKVSERKTGKILYSDRETTRAVDLAENIAGKTALQKAGRVVGIRILQHLAETTE